MPQDYRTAMAVRLDSCAQNLSRSKTPPAGSVADLARALTATKGQSEPLLFALAVALRAELEDVAAYRRARPEDILHALLFAVVRLDGTPRPLVNGDTGAAAELVGRIQSRLYTDRRGDLREYERRSQAAPPSPPAPLDPADRLDLAARLDRLKSSDRALLIEAGAYGLDHNDLAEEFGVAPGTARNRLVEARKQARETPARPKRKGRP
jgi:DNA-directed RNA polymerase specialized sigma24 family protein